MKILFFILCGGLFTLVSPTARAQGKAPAAKAPSKAAPAKPTAAKPAAAKAPVASAAAPKAAPVAAATETDAPARVALAPATPAADPTALKIKAEVNPTTKQLAVRTDSPGPTTIEVNDASGRPVLTRNVIASNKAIDLNVSQLPAGYYIVRCTTGLRTGMRRVHLD